MVIRAVLFADLIDPEVDLARSGAEASRKILHGYHRVLSDVAEAKSGEATPLDHGLMVAFPSTSDALETAIAMQQAVRRPIEGVRLRLRVGVSVGEALRDDRDYFGNTVVIASGLCDRAGSGQILCSMLVSDLVKGRAFRFRSKGKLTLAGISNPLEVCELLYERHGPNYPDQLS